MVAGPASHRWAPVSAEACVLCPPMLGALGDDGLGAAAAGGAPPSHSLEGECSLASSYEGFLQTPPCPRAC